MRFRWPVFPRVSVFEDKSYRYLRWIGHVDRSTLRLPIIAGWRVLLLLLFVFGPRREMLLRDAASSYRREILEIAMLLESAICAEWYRSTDLE